MAGRLHLKLSCAKGDAGAHAPVLNQRKGRRGEEKWREGEGRGWTAIYRAKL
jgi:hypothetical protein